MRRGIRAKYRQPLVPQSEVTFTRCYLTLNLNIAIPMDTVSITQGRATEELGLLHGVSSKCWLCTRVSHVLLHTLIHTHTYGLKSTLRYRYLNLRSSSSRSLSPSRRIPVPVNLCTRHHPKRSSKIPSASVLHCRQKAIAPTFYMGQSRSGTSQA